MTRAAHGIPVGRDPGGRGRHLARAARAASGRAEDERPHARGDARPAGSDRQLPHAAAAGAATGRALLPIAPRAGRFLSAAADRRGRGAAAERPADVQGPRHADRGDGRAAVAAEDRPAPPADRLHDPARAGAAREHRRIHQEVHLGQHGRRLLPRLPVGERGAGRREGVRGRGAGHGPGQDGRGQSRSSTWSTWRC